MVNVTLLILHLFSGLSLTLMSMRLLCRRIFFHEFNFGDYCTMAAMLCASTREAIIHIALTWGTNNLSAAARAKIKWTPEEIHRRTIGSKLVIINRPIYNSFLWLQKAILLHFFLRTFHPDEKKSQYILWSYGFIFLATWFGAAIVGFTECDPVRLYWQVLPPPGSCVQAQVQLVVLGVLNIITDVMLLALPLPVLISLKTPRSTKLRLYILCTLGLFIVAITIIRLPINASNASLQANRSTWANTELLTATIVANAPILYGAFNHWRRRLNNTSYASSTHQGNFSHSRATGRVSHSKTSHQTSHYCGTSSDDDLILRSHCQTTVTTDNNGSTDGNSQEGIILKTVAISTTDTTAVDTRNTK